jgi:hypothetical protein
VVIVEMQPAVEGLSSVAVGWVGSDVGPFVGQGAVETFDFAVGWGRRGRMRLW